MFVCYYCCYLVAVIFCEPTMNEFELDTKFQHFFTMLISGKSGFRKFVFTKKLVAEPKLEKIFCSTMNDSLYMQTL